ncbi:hypothetical protein, partial [Pseudomonas sp. PNPG3]|uniref:hypothetical protein n=1 Tax=Pseudomonas sp. PNPG3 TaxID=2919497 RepID=UPI001FFD9715
AILGTLWTAGAGVGTLVVGWHRPSDVVGAILVVAAWTFAVLALDGLHARRRAVRALQRIRERQAADAAQGVRPLRVRP